MCVVQLLCYVDAHGPYWLSIAASVKVSVVSATLRIFNADCGSDVTSCGRPAAPGSPRAAPVFLRPAFLFAFGFVSTSSRARSAQSAPPRRHRGAHLMRRSSATVFD